MAADDDQVAVILRIVHDHVIADAFDPVIVDIVVFAGHPAPVDAAIGIGVLGDDLGGCVQQGTEFEPVAPAAAGEHIVRRIVAQPVIDAVRRVAGLGRNRFAAVAIADEMVAAAAAIDGLRTATGVNAVKAARTGECLFDGFGIVAAPNGLFRRRAGPVSQPVGFGIRKVFDLIDTVKDIGADQDIVLFDPVAIDADCAQQVFVMGAAAVALLGPKLDQRIVITLIVDAIGDFRDLDRVAADVDLVAILL